MQARYGTRTSPSTGPIQPRTDVDPGKDGGPGKDQDPGKELQDGFTLIELLVVIAILGLLVTLVAPRVLSVLGGAKVSIARDSIERMGSILDMYKLDVGSYPTSEDGLAALLTRPGDAENWNGPYVKDSSVLRDPWSHDYIYREPSTREGHDYDLCSQGQNSNATQDSQICNK